MIKEHSKIHNALKVITNELKNDENYMNAWQANIAMEVVDEYKRYKRAFKLKYLRNSDIHEIANIAAMNFINLLIDKKEK